MVLTKKETAESKREAARAQEAVASGKYDRTREEQLDHYYRRKDTSQIWVCLGRDGKTFVGWVYGGDLREVKNNLANTRQGESDAERTYFVVRAGTMEI